MIGKLTSGSVDIIRSMANTFGYEISVILTPHKIKIKFLDPDNCTRAWDSQHFTKGNIYYEDYANPIKPKYPENEQEADESYDLQLISSERYEEFMEQNLITEIINEGKDEGWITLQTILVVTIMMNLSLLAAILFLILG